MNKLPLFPSFFTEANFSEVNSSDSGAQQLLLPGLHALSCSDTKNK